MNIPKIILNICNDTLRALMREYNFYTVKPSIATLYLTYRCTSQCKTCTTWKRDAHESTETSLDDWIKIISILKAQHIKVIELFGGDVFLKKHILIPLINVIKSLNIEVHIPTNCNLLDEAIAQDLVNAGTDVLYLSTDNIDDQHDHIRGIKGGFEKVKNALNFLRKARTKNQTPKLICNTTVSKFNYSNLEKIILYAIDAGYDEIHFEYVGEMTDTQIDHSLIEGMRLNPPYIQQGESVLLNKQQAIFLKESLQALRKKYQMKIPFRTINIDTLSAADLYRGSIPMHKCYTERSEITIDPSGNITACPFITNYSYGNILTNNFSDIWNNQLHTKFRSYQNNHKLAICDHCILSAQRNHSFLNALRRIYIRRIADNVPKLFSGSGQ